VPCLRIRVISCCESSTFDPDGFGEPEVARELLRYRAGVSSPSPCCAMNMRNAREYQEMMQTSFHIRNLRWNSRLGRQVVSLATFAMLTAGLCCAASVLSEHAPGGLRAPASEAPRIAHSDERARGQRSSLRREWREERSAAMIERMDKCHAVSPESSPPSCLHQSL